MTKPVLQGTFTGKFPALLIGEVENIMFLVLSMNENLVTSQNRTFARRGFCDKCGSSLVFQMNESPESISLTAGSIDDWDVKWGGSDGDQKEGGQGAAEKEGWDKLIRSSVYYWAREKPSWHKLPNDGVVKYFTDPDIEEQPPGWGGEEEDPWETDKKG
ncbi:hypothetical protein ACO22_05673 [Paracoccidioides brasiliensis]|uniref:CENP-V/GFA domain-containing protein n=1 Tax=Paracoccidioides brasiliensis TaxID=121759 RepID=A0A1D2J9S4_PARBR|nr:hypothetical protein ACO22_05673 [Paracoccidioides brasiliensis]